MISNAMRYRVVMGVPRIDQVNIVVPDADEAARFLAALGVAMPDSPPGWEAHHRSVPTSMSVHSGHGVTAPTFGIDLDSASFARQWGGLDTSFTGVVVNLRVDERTDVDRLHERALAIGGRSLKAPYDAFWGARFAVVERPSVLVVGLMSVPDPAARTAPPDPKRLVG